MKAFNLQDMKKKGAVNTGKSVDALIGVLIFIVLAVNLAPEMFSSIAGLENSSDAPGWVSAVLYVIVGAGIVYMAWRIISKNT